MGKVYEVSFLRFIYRAVTCMVYLSLSSTEAVCFTYRNNRLTSLASELFYNRNVGSMLVIGVRVLAHHIIRKSCWYPLLEWRRSSLFLPPFTFTNYYVNTSIVTITSKQIKSYKSSLCCKYKKRKNYDKDKNRTTYL